MLKRGQALTIPRADILEKLFVVLSGLCIGIPHANNHLWALYTRLSVLVKLNVGQVNEG